MIWNNTAYLKGWSFSFFMACLFIVFSCGEKTTSSNVQKDICKERCNFLYPVDGLILEYVVHAKESNTKQADWNAYNGRRKFTVSIKNGDTIYSIRDSGIVDHRQGERPPSKIDTSFIGEPRFGRESIFSTPALTSRDTTSSTYPKKEFGVPFGDLSKWAGLPWCCHSSSFAVEKNKISVESDSIEYWIFTDSKTGNPLKYMYGYGLIYGQVEHWDGWSASLEIDFKLEKINGNPISIDTAL